MSATNIRANETVTIDAVFVDVLSPATKFVQAILVDESGVALPESPLTLARDTLLVDSWKGTFLMPYKSKVTVKSFIYEDAGFLTRTFGFPPVVDEFYRREDHPHDILSANLDNGDALTATIQKCEG